MKKARWVSIILTLAFLLSVIVPHASLAKPEAAQVKAESGYTTQIYWIPTSDPKKAGKILRQLKKGKSPKELGVITGQHQPVKRTLEQIQKKVENAPIVGTYSVNLPTDVTTQATWNPREAFNHDPISLDECTKEWWKDDKKVGPGWIKNRYTYCQSGLIIYQRRPITLPPDVECDWATCDTLRFRLTIVGRASELAREVSFSYKIDEIWASPGNRSWENGTKVAVEIKCLGDYSSIGLDCRANPDPYQSHTLARWKNIDMEVVTFDSDPPPKTDRNPDQVSFMEFFPRVTVNPPGRSTPERTQDGPIAVTRVDSAEYIYVRPPGYYAPDGAVFVGTRLNAMEEIQLVVPTLYYRMRDTDYSVMWPAFEHHRWALRQNPQIPGVRPRKPLHRLYKKYDPFQYEWNREVTQEACRQLPKPGPGKFQCDEYPFASTYEGAATGDFSVRYIPASANQAHGYYLASFYAYERILHKDAFYIAFR